MEENTSMDDVMSEEMLQKLRNWQQEQKNRLMEQQQHQRLLLMEKQKKLLSMINTGDNSNTSENSSFGILEASNFTPEGECDIDQMVSQSSAFDAILASYQLT